MTFWVAGAVVGSAVIGGVSANAAANKQASAIRSGQASQERMFERQNELQEPFRQAGIAGKNRLMDLLGLSENKTAEGYGSAARSFGMDQFQADPGYAFRLQEGLKALDRTAAARGGLLGGNQLRGAVQYGQDLGSQEYGNAFNRFQAERSALLNPLQSLMGAGQTSANTLSDAAGKFGQSQAENAANMGNLRASGYMGTANAISGGINQYLNYRQNQQLMNSLAGGGGGGGYGYDPMTTFSSQQYPGGG